MATREPPAISNAVDILQDPFEVGKNYVGVGNVGFAQAATPFKYGFILWANTSRPLFTNDGDRQVILPFAPENISIDEQAATTITPTQNSGKFIERRGQIMKTITISGTTGFNPNEKLPGFVRRGLPVSVVVEEEGPNSGFANFLRLRNVFREYWAYFSDDASENLDARQNVAFIFVNEKDDEQWVVEPISFRMTRTSPRNKFTYNYEIVMQTIAPAENFYFIADETTLFEDIANVVQIASGVADDISRAADAFGNAIAAVSGALVEAGQLVVSLANGVADSLQSIVNAGDSLTDLLSVDIFKSKVRADATNFVEAYEEFLAVGDEIEAQTGNSQISFVAHTEGTLLLSQMSTILGRQELYSSKFPDQWKKATDSYTPAYGFGGYNANIVDPINRRGAVEAEILPGDSLMNIAIRELGDVERFMEIAVLNNLKPPFVSSSQESRLPNTLAPGDPILIPARGSSKVARALVKTTVFTDPTFMGRVTTGGATTITVDTDGKDFRTNQWRGFTITITAGTGSGQERKLSSNSTNQLTVDKAWTTAPASDSVVRVFLRRVGDTTQYKSANIQALGVDLKVVNGDLVVSRRGGVALVEGHANLSQAIKAKLDTKPGELPAHSSYGLGFPPGQRANTDSLLGYKTAVKQTLLSDQRIEGVKQLQVSASGDTTSLQGYVVVSGRAQPFALDTRGSI